MRYVSTRDAGLRLSGAEAIVRGLSREGGLFLPERIPQLSREDLQRLSALPYDRRAAWVMSQYLEEFSLEELEDYTRKAYCAAGKFDAVTAAPVVKLPGDLSVLELWHGPTSAFKDMALQVLPYLLTASLKKTGEDKQVLILAATSGDTGKAAMEGFRDVPQTKILVFYPENGVSEVQKLQMQTQEGKNVGVCAVKGNFDDAQTGVKQLFSDAALRERLEGRSVFLSSANSINWGRVLPQIAYYISAYCDMAASGAVSLGEPIQVCVPTGNFGNILAAYYAKEMGLPVGRLICASNSNNVLTEFIRTGVYDRNRRFFSTSSPSMDILISSNLERLLFLLTGSDREVRTYMESLKQTGRYAVSEAVLKKLQSQFSAWDCDDKKTLDAIGRVWTEDGYLLDTHTAVGYHAAQECRRQTGDRSPMLLVSTASPFKFSDSVLKALGAEPAAKGLDGLEQLAKMTKIPAPAPLAQLRGKPVRFTGAVEKTEMEAAVMEMLA